MSPHVAIFGNILQPSRLFVYVDGEPLVAPENLIDAFIIVYQIYYCLWLQFPKSALASYKYLQSYIFNHQDGPLPAKLVRLLTQTV